METSGSDTTDSNLTNIKRHWLWYLTLLNIAYDDLVICVVFMVYLKECKVIH